MQDNCKNERVAVSISVLIHSIVFVLIAATGLFVRIEEPQKQVFDVAVYDTEEASRSSGSGSAEAVAGGGASGSEIVMKTDTKVPSISEHYTEEAQKSEQEKEQKEKAEKKQADKPQAGQNDNAAENAGNGFSKGSGEGTGKGAGNGTGNGNNNGNGNGAGTGNGKENGDDTANALRPKIPPQLITVAEVSYPEELRSEGIEGQVVLKMIVGADGSVESVSIAGSSGYDEMDRAAEAAAYQYRFSPAENSAGNPVRCGVRRTFNFSLN